MRGKSNTIKLFFISLSTVFLTNFETKAVDSTKDICTGDELVTVTGSESAGTVTGRKDPRTGCEKQMAQNPFEIYSLRKQICNNGICWDDDDDPSAPGGSPRPNPDSGPLGPYGPVGGLGPEQTPGQVVIVGRGEAGHTGGGPGGPDGSGGSSRFSPVGIPTTFCPEGLPDANVMGVAGGGNDDCNKKKPPAGLISKRIPSDTWEVDPPSPTPPARTGNNDDDDKRLLDWLGDHGFRTYKRDRHGRIARDWNGDPIRNEETPRLFRLARNPGGVSASSSLMKKAVETGVRAIETLPATGKVGTMVRFALNPIVTDLGPELIWLTEEAQRVVLGPVYKKLISNVENQINDALRAGRLRFGYEDTNRISIELYAPVKTVTFDIPVDGLNKKLLDAVQRARGARIPADGKYQILSLRFSSYFSAAFDPRWSGGDFSGWPGFRFVLFMRTEYFGGGKSYVALIMTKENGTAEWTAEVKRIYPDPR